MRKNNGHIEILIAEDSPTQAELLRQLLEAHHYKVTMAANGKLALAQLALQQPALVISDVVMPELDGYGLCKAIKADDKLKHIPVILVTTLSDPDDVIRGLECGADNFIRKPYEEKYLLSRIDYLLINVELRKNQRMQMALEINLGGKNHVINAERQQILDLLVSTYEQAVQVNGELREREKELAHSNQVLQGLNRISEALNSAASEREVTEIVLRHALELPGIQAGWISLRTAESGFRIAATCGLPPALSGPDAFDGDCACRRQLLNGKLATGTNVIQCERLAKTKGDTQGLCCHASIPLWLKSGQSLGVMNLAGHGSRLFSQEELKVLHGIGNQIAVALERGMLHGHLEQLVDERTAALTMEIAERKRIQEEQARLVAIIEATPDLIGTATPEGRLLYANQAGMRMMGVKESDLPALRIQDAHPEWAGKLVREEGIPHAISHGFWSGETALLGSDGREIPVLQVILVHKGPDGAVAYLSTIARDITQRKASEARIARLNRIYEVLSGINTTIVRVRDEEELFKEACRIAVEHGQFTFAWIGKFDPSSRQVTPVAQAGHHDGYLAQINLIAGEGIPGSCSLTTQALTEGKPAVCNDIASDERMAPWRDAALRLGYRSVTVFPLLLEGQPFGVFALYAAETNAFDDEEMQLLVEMSGDISYALDNLRLEVRRKQAEAALRSSNEGLDRMLNSMAEGAYGVDVHGNCTFVNRAFLQMLGYQDDKEVLGQHIHELIHHSYADGRPYPASECRMYRAYQTHQAIHVSDEVFWRKDGVAIPVEYWSHPIVTDGEVTGAIATFIDITERKQAEVALLQLNESLEHRVVERTTDLERSRREADDANQANQAKSAFLSTMSHEIRTPMNGVIGMVDVLAQSKLSEHQSDLVNTIRESANSLLGIIDDILDFSKIEAGRLQFERMPVAVADLVEGLCNSLVPVAALKGVDLFLFVSPDIPERIWSDEIRLRQVLNNLVGNAIKFSKGTFDKRGKVSIRAEVAQAAPLRLMLRVIDNGIGMAPETLSNLFTPFTQAEVSTTRRFGGTGLGLAITKRLVDLMQGEITAESTPGAGSIFTVTMPFEVPADQPLRSLPDLSGLDCIILEDPEIHADDLRAYLAHAGAQVSLVNDAADAARAAAKLGAMVVVILEAEHRTEPAVAQALFAALPNVRRLLITRGRRRCARVYSATTVTLDGDGLRRLALLRAVAVAADRASPEIFHERFEASLASDESPPTIADARAQGRLILVAEDDEINQKVILKQLDLLGYAAEIAGNGAEALRLWRNRDYALLLTDLHMPEMDGYTLAQTIRREEAGTDHIPILALTANALRGEASHVLASGMDAYLTKPILLVQLKSALEKWLPRAADSTLPADRAEVNQGQRGAAVDVGVLKGLVGDDPETVREFLSDYLASAQSLADEMDAALAASDVRHIGAIAHKFKSSSRSVGALVLGDMCADLENFGKTGDMEAIVQGLDKFNAALADVEAEIARFLAG